MEGGEGGVGGVGEEVDDVADFEEVAGPAMEENEWDGVWTWGLVVDEVERNWLGVI